MLRKGFFIFQWHGKRESNPQPTVLETAALPIELFPYFSVAIVETHRIRELLKHFGYTPFSNGKASFTNGEALALLYGDRFA